MLISWLYVHRSRHSGAPSRRQLTRTPRKAAEAEAAEVAAVQSCEMELFYTNGISSAVIFSTRGI